MLKSKIQLVSDVMGGFQLESIHSFVMTTLVILTWLDIS